MKNLFIAAASFALFSASAFGQSATITFNDNSGTANAGSYNPTDTFTLDVSLTLTGFDSAGLIANSLSYFLQVPTTLAPFISITSITYFSFTDSIQPSVPKMFVDGSGANAGFLSEKGASDQGDLGAVANAGENQGDGTFQVTSLTFTLNGAPTGTYSLLTTTNSPKASVVGDTTFSAGTAIPAAAYTITVVPEPSTWALVTLGGIGAIGLFTLRRRRA